MKLQLFIQFAGAVLLALAMIIEMVAAFYFDSVAMWKVFTVIMVVLSILFFKQALKELK